MNRDKPFGQQAAAEPHSKVSLRQKAEAQFWEREDLSLEILARMSVEDIGMILHELRAANEQLGNLFNYSNASIIVWDTQLRITSVNRAFASLVGKNASEIHGSPLESLFPPDFLADSMGMIKRMLSGERAREKPQRRNNSSLTSW